MPRMLRALLALVVLLASFASISAASAAPASKPPSDCPPGLKCVVQYAALIDATAKGDGSCGYTKLGAATNKRTIVGVVEHTTEGSTESALAQAQDPNVCITWNYLVAPDGTIYVTVPLDSVAYTAGNRFFNTDYVQVEHVGSAGLCDITSQQYAASAQLTRWLSQRFNFKVDATTVIGHDNVPGSYDAVQSVAHWDPGVCWDWNAFRALAGGRDYPRLPKGNAVVINPVFATNHQPASDCTDGSVCDVDAVNRTGTNFVTLYTAPSTTAPLVSDPYIHPDGSAGTTAMNDWGSKAPTGHRYVVAKRQPGWTAIWFSGQLAWFQDNGTVSHPTKAKLVTPKSASIPVYSRPLPTAQEFAASGLPADVIAAQNVPNQLTKYSLLKGQSYVLASDTVKNEFFEGCDKPDCSGSFDGIYIKGKEKYLGIEWNHRLGFVKASDVTVS